MRRHYVPRTPVTGGGNNALTVPIAALSAQALVPTISQAAAGSAAADWAARSSGPGVIWAHNFDTASEFLQFCKTDGYGIDNTGTHGTTATWVADGFAGGGCVSIAIPTGGTANGGWSRPMSAIAAGNNGKATADPAANGTVAVQSWDATQPSAAYNWRKGYYTHPAIQAAFPFWPTSATTGVYDGTEIWFSVRVKIQGTRWTSGNPPGKLFFIDVTEGLSNEQEIVVRSMNRTGDFTGTTYATTNPFNAYTSRGDDVNSIIAPTQGSYSGSMEPGGPYASSCTFGGTRTPGQCWEFPADQWTTLLIHFIPGRDNSAFVGQALSAWPYNDAVLEVWKCDIGETAWTKVFEHFSLKWYYYSDPQSGQNGPDGHWHAPAFNEFLFSGYMNGVPSVAGWYQRFTQAIFSKDWIAPPGQTAPAYWISQTDNSWQLIGGAVGKRITDVTPSPLPSTPLGGEGVHGITDAWCGMSVDPRRREMLLIAGGGHADYPGNEGYAFDLSSSSPGWRRISDPTPNSYLSTYTSSNGVNTYGDGRPCADHTSGWPVYLDGRIWFLGQSATPPGGNASTGISSYDRDRLGAALTPLAHTDNGGAFNPWTTHGAPTGMTSVGAGSMTFGVGCADPYDHYAYGFSGYGYDRTTFYYWRVKTIGPTRGQSTAAIANGGNPYANIKWCACAHDLRIIVCGDGSPNQRILVLDLTKFGASDAWQSVTNVTGTGYYPTGSGIGCGAGYVAINNTIGVGDPPNIGSTIKRLRIPTKIVSGRKVYDPAGQWQWSNITPTGATVQFSAAERTFTKFNYVPDMGDGRSAFVYIGGWDLPVFIYKVPAAGL